MFFSLSLYPCCSFIFFSPLARRLWFCLGFSPLDPCLRDRWLAVGAPAPRSFSFTTTCSADCEDWSKRFVAAAVRRWFPTPLQTPLCVPLGCVHPHNEGLHHGLLPRRGPSVRPGISGVSSILVSLHRPDFIVTFERYFFVTCSDDFLFFFLVIVTCFAMSFALRSDATARLILDASLALHAGGLSHVCELC